MAYDGRMSDGFETRIYDRIGEEGFHRLCAAFYRRVREDDLVGPMYPDDDWVGAEQRLRDFLVLRFGGPARYLQERGHPRLRARHIPFPIDREARDRWVTMMEAAMDEVELPGEVIEPMRAFFHHAATFLINRAPQPD